MDVLKDMFPQYTDEVLQQVLDDNQGDIEATLAVLLSPEFEPPKPHPINLPPAAEFEWKQPSRTFENEWKNTKNKAISRGLKEMVNSSDLSDVLLNCNDGTTVYAHELIVAARSEYLAVLLSTVEPDVMHGNRKRLEVDMTKPVCLLVLEFLYTDHCHIKDDLVPQVHQAATEIDQRGLQKLCEGADIDSSFYPEQILKLLDTSVVPPTFDITLEAEGEMIEAHKMILSLGSEYFKEMFSSHFMEKSQAVVKIPDIKYSELKLVVEFIYSNGWVHRGVITPENLFHYFSVANEFLVRGLQSYTEELITKHLEVENVCEVLVEAGQLSTALRRSCYNFIGNHYDEVTTRPEYIDLPSLTKMEVEHVSAKQNEEALAALISVMAGVDVSDLQKLIQDEVAEFLEYQLSLLSLEDQLGTIDSPFGTVDYTVSGSLIGPLPDNPSYLKKVEDARRIQERKTRARDRYLELVHTATAFREQTRAEERARAVLERAEARARVILESARRKQNVQIQRPPEEEEEEDRQDLPTEEHRKDLIGEEHRKDLPTEEDGEDLLAALQQIAKLPNRPRDILGGSNSSSSSSTTSRSEESGNDDEVDVDSDEVEVDSEEDSSYSESGSSGSDSDSSRSSDSSDSFEGLYFAKDSISCSFGARKLTLIVNDIGIGLRDGKWSYIQQLFPRAEDKGTFTAEIKGARIALSFNIVAADCGIPTLSLGEFSVSVDNVNVKIGGSPVDWIYNLFLKAFRKTLKKSLIETLQHQMASKLGDLAQHINSMGDRARNQFR